MYTSRTRETSTPSAARSAFWIAGSEVPPEAAPSTAAADCASACNSATVSTSAKRLTSIASPSSDSSTSVSTPVTAIASYCAAVGSETLLSTPSADDRMAW